MNLTLPRDPATGRYILRFDASLYKQSGCNRYVWYKAFRGLTSEEGEGFHAGYGNAFHKGLRVLYSGGDIDTAIAAAIAYHSKVVVPPSQWKNTAHLVNCLMMYHAYWKKEGDMLKAGRKNEKLLVEQTFAYPYYRTDRTEVLLCGTMDLIGTYAHQPCITDHKTNAPKKVNTYAIDQYLRGYTLSPQLMLYRMIYRLLFPEDPAPGCLVNGIFLSETNKNMFKRSELFNYSPQQMIAFKAHLDNEIQRGVRAFEWLLDSADTPQNLDTAFPQNFTCCDSWCEYLPICASSQEGDKESVIQFSYKSKPYDPLLFQQGV